MDNEKQSLSRGKLIVSILWVSIISAIANHLDLLFSIRPCPDDYLSYCPEGTLKFLFWGFVVGIVGSLLGYFLKRNIWGVTIGGLLSGMVLFLSKALWIY